jgi:hypothetical protein
MIGMLHTARVKQDILNAHFIPILQMTNIPLFIGSEVLNSLKMATFGAETSSSWHLT